MTFDAYALETASRLTDHPLHVKAQGRVGVSPDEIFDFITDIERLASWLPTARRSWSDDTKAEHPMQVGAVRMIDPGFGPPAEETVVLFERPRAYAYKASDATLKGMLTDHLGVITVESHPSGGSVLTWLAFGKPPRSKLMAALGKKVLAYVLYGGIRRLERKFPV
jgi:carbon monoxide dehydrogenase subunit G